MKRLLPVAALAVALTGCFFSRRPKPLSYDPLPPALLEPGSTPIPPATLRLRHVRAKSYLDERVAWRASSVEVGEYDDRFWTAAPAELVELALARRLFERDGLTRATTSAPTLEVTVIAFDEVVRPEHEAQVALVVSLVDEHDRPLHVETVIARRPVSGESPRALAWAMGAALAEAVDRVATATETALQGDHARADRSASPE